MPAGAVTQTVAKTTTTSRPVKKYDWTAGRSRDASVSYDNEELRMDLESSSSSQDDDDFGKDMLADIAQDQVERAERAANPGKRRKKAPATEKELQTKKTRKAYKQGQAREVKTSKWAIRERRRNPLIKLLDIELECMASNSDSSSGSIDTDCAKELSDTSRAFYARSRRRRQQLHLHSAHEGKRAKIKAESSEDEAADIKRIFPGQSKIGSHAKPSWKMSQKKSPERPRADSSATEDSDHGNPSARNAARSMTLPIKKEEDAPQDNLRATEIDSSSSEDISPIVDPEGYKAQLARRKSKQQLPNFKSKLVTAATSTSSVQREADKTVKTEDSGTQSDSDAVPDLPVTHPKYAAWMKRRSERGQKPEMAFKPYQQMDARPHFDIKTSEQAALGPFRLGTDAAGHAVEVPKAINRFLRKYQQEGVRFFWEHYRTGEGGLLGDDMGLGKTIQVIAFLAAIMRHRCQPSEENRRIERNDDMLGNINKPTDHGPTALIIAPASVLENWAREFATWTYLSAEIYRPGHEKERHVIRNFKRGRLDVVIAGVESVRKNILDLCDLDFSCIFVDEAHRVKNPTSQTTIAFHKFACKTRFGLTGTAMQNRYSELHTLLDWCFPGCIGDASQWKDYVETPLKDAQKKDATQAQLAIGRTRAVALVQYLLPHFFLRRTKELIADQLPKKTDQIVFCPLTEDQTSAYKRLLCHPEVQIILTHDEPCPCGNTDDAGLPYAAKNCCHDRWYMPMLKWLAVFSKVANHAVLIYPNKADRVKDPPKFAQDMEITRLAFPDSFKARGPERYASSFVDMDSSLCGKWPVLKDLLARWKERGDKVLLFSRSTRLLDALQYWLERVPYELVRLDGQVPTEKRLPLCDEFNNPQGNKFIFLISTFAGGVGLNLTAANRVVIFDPNWNPVADLQAMDRSYRWGQTRDVFVYRLIGAGSLEELIYTRQIYKQHQAEIAYNAAAPSRMFVGVQDDPNNHGELFGVKNIFRFNEASSRTKHSIEQAQISELSYALLNHTITKSGKGKKKAVDEEDEDAVLPVQTEDGLIDNQAVLDAMVSGVKGENQENDDDEIARILRSNGVTYTHSHTSLVRHSTTEERISKAAVREFSDARKRGHTSNQRASNVKMKMASSWAPSKGVKSETAEEHKDPFEMLFQGGDVRGEILAELAESLDYQSPAAMARAFATMDKRGQARLIQRAQDMVAKYEGM